MGWGLVIQAVLLVISLVYQNVQARKQKERMKKMQEEADRRADAAKGFQIVTEGEAAPLFKLYGRGVAGGIRVYHNTFNAVNLPGPAAGGVAWGGLNATGGQKHEFMMIQQALSFAGIHRVISIEVDDLPYSDPKHAGWCYFHTYLNGGVADPLAYQNDVWRADSTFTNTAYATALFRINRDDPQYSGVPNCRFYLEGSEVAGISLNAGVYSLTTKSYTNNAALCLLDYLIDNISGRGLDLASINMQSFYAAAALSDVVVIASGSKEGRFWGNTPGARVVRRFESNLAVSSAESIRDNIEKLLEGMDMAELIWSEGQYKLSLNYPLVYTGGTSYDQNAVVQYISGEAVDLYRSLIPGNNTLPTTANWARDVLSAPITDDDIMRGKEMSISFPNAQSRFNLVTCRFRNEAKNFAEDTVGWPDKSTQVYESFMLEDGNVPLETDIYEDAVTDYNHALAKAEQRCRYSRISVIYKLTLSIKFVGLEPGDLKLLYSDLLKVNGELLRVTEVKINDDGTVAAEFSRFNAEALAWNASDSLPVIERNVHDEGLAQATDLKFKAESRQLVTSVGTLYWNAANDSRVHSYSIRFTTTPPEMVSFNTTWEELGTTRNLFFEIMEIPAGTYTLAVVAMSNKGKSAPKFNTTNGSHWPAISTGIGAVVSDHTTVYRATVYIRQFSAPAAPVGGVFDFQTLTFTTAPVGWATSVPVGALQLYSSDAVLREGSSVIDWTTPIPIVSATSYAALTKNTVTILQNDSGVNFGYGDASVKLKAVLNNLDVSADVGTTYSVVRTTSCDVVMTYSGVDKGNFIISNLVGDLGSATVSVTFGGATFERTVSAYALKTGYQVDLTPPPVPTSATTVVGLNNVFITLPSLPSYTEGHGHSRTEIWGSGNLTSTSDVATFLDHFDGTTYTYPSKLNTPLQIWLRYKSKDGVLSGFYGGVNGIDATTGKIQSGDLETKVITRLLLGDGVVDTLQVADGAIQNAKIGNIIESTTYNQGFTGWKIDKAGSAEFNNLTVYDGAGGVLMSSGGGTNWGGISGAGKPANNATRNVSRGAWAVGVAYDIGDVVSKDGSSWSALAVHTSSAAILPPTLPTTNNSYWALFASKGAIGDSAELFELRTSSAVIAKSSLGVMSPTTFIVSLFNKVGNNNYTPYLGRFKIYENDSSTAIYTSSINESSYAYGVPGTLASLKVEAYLSGGTSVLVDVVSTPVVFDGSDAITVVLSNEAHTVPASDVGVVSSYTGSGTTISVWEGATQLSYATSNPFNSQFTIGTPAVSPVGSMATGSFTNNGNFATVGAHSAMSNSEDVASITYPITVKKYDGSSFSFSKTQTITKSKRGIQGPQGIQGLQGIQGPQGTQGIQGPTGADGQATYFHIKYSNDGGSTFTASSGETPGSWIGTCSDFSAADPASIGTYSWVKVEGAQGPAGDQGIAGVNGSNGQTSYLHIKYSNDGGSTFTASSGEAPGSWIGQYVDFTLVDSSSVGSYTWSKIEGAQGIQGLSSVSAVLSNESHTVSADAAGVVSSFLGCSTTISVYEGTTDVTSLWGITPSPSVGLSGSLTSSTYTVVSLSVDSAYVDFTLTRANYASIIKRFSVNKSRGGAAGNDANGAYIAINASSQVFTYVDGVAAPASQSVTLGVARANIATAAVFSTAPTVFLGGSGDTRTLAIADFGVNREVVVTCTVGALVDSITIVRLERSTAEAGATVGANIGTNLSGQINSANATTYIADGAIGNALIGNVIQSSSYAAGSAGWKIDKTGAMEMNNATFRGTLDIRSAGTAHLEVKNNVIKVFDSNGVLRVKLGDLSA